MQIKFRHFPWVTAAAATFAVALAWAPGLSDSLVYDRGAILGGQVWRLWTGNWVHFSESHLLWNLLVVVCAGAWVELAGFAGWKWVWALAPCGVSLVLLAAEGGLTRYGGLSGVATALIVFGCLSELKEGGHPKSLWNAVLLLLAFKIGWEFLSGESVFAQFAGANVRVVPLSHLAGAATAAIIVFYHHKRKDSKPPAFASEISSLRQVIPSP